MANRDIKYKNAAFQEINLSDNVAAQELELAGTFLREAEIVASLDNAVTITFKSANGSTIVAFADLDATSGVIKQLDPDGDGTLPLVFCVGKPTVTVAGLGSGTLQLIVVGSYNP